MLFQGQGGMSGVWLEVGGALGAGAIEGVVVGVGSEVLEEDDGG